MLLKNLEKIRRAHGMTQEHLGIEMGVTGLYIAGAEYGMRVPTHKANAIADYFGVATTELTGEEPEVVYMPPDKEDYEKRISILERDIHNLQRREMDLIQTMQMQLRIMENTFNRLENMEAYVYRCD